MTPKRKAALQWFHERGIVSAPLSRYDGSPGDRMIGLMIRAGHLQITDRGWTLTDKGRRDLHEADL